MSNWYLELDPNEHLSQGDILMNLPIVLSQPIIDEEDPYNIKDVDNIVDNMDVVVMTQACDLETKGVETVVLAPLFDPIEMHLDMNRWSFIAEVHAGRRANYALIGKHTGEITMNYKIVDFSQVFTLSYDFIAKFIPHHGKRLRLNTPHREQLSQQFGNYFARIGLPNEDFINKKVLKEDLGL
ncbi:hypothetical protein ACFCW7_23310 [Paenibacillus glucanolyticus]|uniref:hypothetical protein n=1 Tax=Paenibacillus glucanolyticus TaxID=59843 RepID=UPI0035E2CDD7